MHRTAPQLLFSNAQDSIEAKYIRHPAAAWFLPAGTAPPRMRCGSGPARCGCLLRLAVGWLAAAGLWCTNDVVVWKL